MLQMRLIRSRSVGPVTHGVLSVPGLGHLYTLEDQVREPDTWTRVADWKIHGQTAIPLGVYTVVLTLSQRFKVVLPELLDVPGFAGIRIHAGNVIDDTDGCILVGLTAQQRSIGQSRTALDRLLRHLTAQSAPIT